MTSNGRFPRHLSGLVVLVSGIFLAGWAAAQDYPEGIVGAKTATSRFSPDGKCTITVELQHLVREKLEKVADDSGTTYRRFPYIHKAAMFQEVGKPELPYVKVNVPLPGEGRAEISVENVQEAVRWEDVVIAPARKPWPELPKVPCPPLEPEPKVYNRDETFPYGPAARLGPTTRLRGRLMQTCLICPVRYNPVKKVLTLNRVVATLHFSPIAQSEWAPGPRVFKPALSYSSEFAGGYLQLLDDFRPPSRSEIQTAIKEHRGQAPNERVGCDYLAIVPDEQMSQALRPLIAAKEKRMWRPLAVRLVTFSDMGLTGKESAEKRRETILRTIRREFDLVPRPSYLLLAGDARAIPPFFRDRHPDDGEDGIIATDLFYSTLEGSDLLPDILTGRLPARNAGDLKIMVEKILAYETTLEASGRADWGNALIAAYYENEVRNGKTTTRRWFHQTAYSVDRFLKDELKTVHHVYTAERPDAPLPWHHYDGTQLPEELVQAIRTFAAPPGSATQFITTRWADRVRLVLHRDHGFPGGWGEPPLDVSHIARLPQPAIPPLVLSMNCRSGWYDGDSPCFAEALMRHPHGAAAVIAASRASWSLYNDRFTEGLIKGIWDNFILDFQLPAPEDDRVTLGSTLNTAQTHLDRAYSGIYVDCTLQLFNLFGDPEMTVRRLRAVAAPPPPKWIAAPEAKSPRKISFPSSLGLRP